MEGMLMGIQHLPNIWTHQFVIIASKKLIFLPFFFFKHVSFGQMTNMNVGGCSSVGQLAIGRSLVQISALLGWAELHVEVSLSKILNPNLLLASMKGPAMSCQLVPCPCPETAGIGSSKILRDPIKRDKVIKVDRWMDKQEGRKWASFHSWWKVHGN